MDFILHKKLKIRNGKLHFMWSVNVPCRCRMFHKTPAMEKALCPLSCQKYIPPVFIFAIFDKPFSCRSCNRIVDSRSLTSRYKLKLLNYSPRFSFIDFNIQEIQLLLCLVFLNASVFLILFNSFS